MLHAQTQDVKKDKAIPPVDINAPAEIKTATFALG